MSHERMREFIYHRDPVNLVCIHKRTWHNGVFDQGLDGLLLDVGYEIDHHLTTALYHAKDG